MALEIVAACVGCHGCEPLCPNQAISMAAESGAPLFVIDPDACTECLGDHDLPQCAEICPIEGAIVDERGEPLNPPGSLSAIPPRLRGQERMWEGECRR
jgi:ferredoxin